MSETPKAFNMRRIFVKDLSFEHPNAALPRLNADGPAQLEVTVSAAHEQREYDGLWDVTLGLTLHSRDKESGATNFLVEVKQGAFFEISGVSSEERDRLLTTECREAVYPFLRNLVWMVGAHAGIKGMLLSMMEFDELYQRAVQSGETASASSGD